MTRARLLGLVLAGLMAGCQPAAPALPTATPSSEPARPTAGPTGTPPRPSPSPPRAAASPSPSPSPTATPVPTATPPSVGPTAERGYRAASPEYGLSAFLMGHADTTARDLKKITDLGFGWVKLTLPWRAIEGAGRGRFDWSEADRTVRAARAAGLRVIARLDFQPSWARDDRAANGPPRSEADFASFVGALVGRYRQGAAGGTVDAVQLWNEVNLDREWGGGPINRASAEQYVRLLRAGYQAAKRADPAVTVIAAPLSPTGIDDDTARPDDVYLGWLYEAGAGPYFDVLGVNANVQCPCVDAAPGSLPAFTHPSFYFRRVEQLRRIMVERGDGDKQVWLMEFGWTTDRVNPAFAWYATTEERKSELILEAFRYARAYWAPWIGVMTLWTIADPAWQARDEQVWWSVTNPDGSTRPAYDRLLRARREGLLP